MPVGQRARAFQPDRRPFQEMNVRNEMYTDSITPGFIAIFVAILLFVLLLFPVIDYVSYRKAKKNLPYKNDRDNDREK